MTATNAPAEAAIVRTPDHNYGYLDDAGNRTWVPGVTGIISVLDKSDAIGQWMANSAAEAAVDLAQRKVGAYSALDILLDIVGPEGVAKALASSGPRKRDAAGQLGSSVHAWADKLLTTGLDAADIASMTEPVLKRVNVYAEWWQASGWKRRLSEAYVVSPGTGYGGTFDLLAYDADGKTVLADLKTGTGVFREAIVQLTAYGLAPLVARPGDPRAYPMPVVDRYVIIHVQATKVREIDVPVGQAERMAFLDCLDLHRWLTTVKGRL
jgi:Glutamyl-tRNA reductase